MSLRDLVLGALGEHHDGEDHLLWPKLRERAAPATASSRGWPTSTRPSPARSPRPPSWRTRADRDTALLLAEALRALDRHAAAHMDDEWEHLMPLMADHITLREWSEVGERGHRSVPKAKFLILLGAILEDDRTGTAAVPLTDARPRPSPVAHPRHPPLPAHHHTRPPDQRRGPQA
ncbi:hypothetical protein [Kitasatospora purpeofusca]|uniref:hypothetical protein n=1 Tax=Kitasatospora purpeofusca TaxID=67352 RepID=UPI0036B1DA5B